MPCVSRSRLVPVSLWLLLSGCGSLAVNLIEGGKSNDCAAPRPTTGAWTAPALIERGDQYLENGRRGVDGSLERAIVCYDHALQLGRDNYRAHLGLGVANLILSKGGDKESVIRLAAQQHLGLAFIYSQAHLEPLYYMAELTAINGAYGQARKFLAVLEAAAYKPGPVNALLGFVWQKEGNREQARKYFEKAVHEGWPIETARYAQEEK